MHPGGFNLARLWLASGALAGASLLGACERRYPQDSAQAVIASARRMVERDHAERLTDLIYADSKDMRELLDHVGALLGSLQDLGTELERTFPDEIARLRAATRRAAERGEADEALSRVFTGRPPISDRDADPGKVFNDMLVQVLADPYAFLDEQTTRLTSVPVADDMAVLQWDGQPLFGPLVGLTLKEEDGRWQLMLPTHLPMVAKWVQDEERRQLIEELIGVLDNAVRDLRADVRSGKIESLDQAAEVAGEYAFLPMGLVMIAISKYADEDRKVDAPAAEPQGG